MSVAIVQLMKAILDMTRTLSQSQEQILKTTKHVNHDSHIETANTLKQVCEDCNQFSATAMHKVPLVPELDEARSKQASSKGMTSSKRKVLPHPSNNNTTNRVGRSSGRKHHSLSSECGSESESDTSLEETLADIESMSTKTCHGTHNKYSRLIPFSGKDKWKVWHRQFEVCTKGWSMTAKLEEILLLMRGPAADIVFDQLPVRSLNSYSSLIKELDSRFSKVENPQTYRRELRKLKQQTESAVEFAVEIKRLYDKAYPNRDIRAQKEDLLQKFWDGLKDQRTASQVQFIRNPEDIDEAVTAVVTYQELHGMLENISISSTHSTKAAEDSQSNERTTNRLPLKEWRDKKSKPRLDFHMKIEQGTQTEITLHSPDDKVQSSLQSEGEHQEKYNIRRTFQDQRESALPNRRQFVRKHVCTQHSSSRAQHSFSQPQRTCICFKCGGPNHIAKNCLAPVTGKMPIGWPIMKSMQSPTQGKSQYVRSATVTSEQVPPYIYPSSSGWSQPISSGPLT
jgi:hypothetical protein